MNVSLASVVVGQDVQRVLTRLDLRHSLAGKRLLLTGSTGFFGAWLLAMIDLLNRSHAGIQVTALSRDPSRFLQKHPGYADAPWLTWLQGDVLALSDLTLEHPVDLVIHGATDTSASGQADPLRLFDIILNGARNVLDLAVRSGAQRVLFTGSGAQYGPLEPDVPVSEGDPRSCNPLLLANVYGEAKRAQETLAAIYAARFGIDVVLTRCFAFSGPGIALDGHFAIGNFLRDALWREELVLQSTGEAVRSYLHGADLAGWLLTLLVRGASGEAYNVGSDQGLTIADLARKVLARVAPEKPLRILGQQAGGARSYYVPQIQKARDLGLEVWTGLDQSIDSMASWVREHDTAR